ncbi:hypothetical protein GGI05_003570, partial [Coemansia sp. RSA 2603]
MKGALPSEPKITGAEPSNPSSPALEDVSFSDILAEQWKTLETYTAQDQKASGASQVFYYADD